MLHNPMAAILLCCCTLIGKGQYSPIGSWRVLCVYEGAVTDKTAESLCPICPLSRNKEELVIPGIELKITKTEMKLRFNREQQQTITYEWRDSTGTVGFVANNRTYLFKVLYAKDHQVWRNEDGTLLVLTSQRKKVSHRERPRRWCPNCLTAGRLSKSYRKKLESTVFPL